jgi:hypothetical protein
MTPAKTSVTLALPRVIKIVIFAAGVGLSRMSGGSATLPEIRLSRCAYADQTYVDQLVFFLSDFSVGPIGAAGVFEADWANNKPLKMTHLAYTTYG